MAKYTADLTAAEFEALREIFAGNPGFTAESWGDCPGDLVTAAINEAGMAHLQARPADWDGSVDDDGQIWFNGEPTPLTVIHNA
jgi:hypothetical protein